MSFLHYRNAQYQGRIQNKKRHGPGILVYDDASLQMGYWVKDQLQGPYLKIISQQQYVYGQKQFGLNHGVNIMVDQFSAIIGQFQKGQANGIFMYYERLKRSLKVMRIQKDDSILLKQMQIQEANSQNLGLIIRRCQLQKYVPQLNKKFYDFAIFAETLLYQLNSMDSSLGNVRFGKSMIFFGFVKQQKANGLGFMMTTRTWPIINSIGKFKQNQLQGMVRIYFHNQFFFQGYVQQGVICGKAIKYILNDDQFIFAEYQNNQIKKVIQRGNGFPVTLAVSLRKQSHLSAYDFQNKFTNSASSDFPDLTSLLNLISTKPLSRLKNSPTRRLQQIKKKSQVVDSPNLVLMQLKKNIPVKSAIQQTDRFKQFFIGEQESIVSQNVTQPANLSSKQQLRQGLLGRIILDLNSADKLHILQDDQGSWQHQKKTNRINTPTVTHRSRFSREQPIIQAIQTIRLPQRLQTQSKVSKQHLPKKPQVKKTLDDIYKQLKLIKSHN